jgi:hypothetical protein
MYTQGDFNFTVDAYNITIDDRIVLSKGLLTLLMLLIQKLKVLMLLQPMMLI